MIHTHDSIEICTDCLLWLANGERPVDNPDDWQPPQFAERVQCVPGNGQADEFSTAPCGACNSSLAGARHDATIMTELDTGALSERDVWEFINAYIECALWSSTVTADDSDDSEPVPADQYSLSEDAKTELYDIAARFACESLANHWLATLPQAQSENGPYSLAHAGHDYWLTCAGHGAGFWDGDLPEQLGEDLTTLCKGRERELYLGDDGLIEIF